MVSLHTFLRQAPYSCVNEIVCLPEIIRSLHSEKVGAVFEKHDLPEWKGIEEWVPPDGNFEK